MRHVLALAPGASTYAESAATAATLALLPWALVSVIGLPLLSGQPPQWTASGMRALFPSLVIWMLIGALAGLLLHALATLVGPRLSPETGPVEHTATPATRVVIPGGGFAGGTTAAKLERAFGPDPSVSLTLVSDTNALLFTPMLAEVPASSLEATHISSPLRTGLRRTQVIRRPVIDIDLAARCVRLAPDEYTPAPPEVPFDHPVLAFGAVSNYLGLGNVENEAFDFKTVGVGTRCVLHDGRAVDCGMSGRSAPLLRVDGWHGRRSAAERSAAPDHARRRGRTRPLRTDA